MVGRGVLWLAVLLCGLRLAGYYVAAEPVTVRTPFPANPDCRLIGVPKNTRPNKTRPGKITIEGVLQEVVIDPSTIQTLRPDIFKKRYFSVFDVLVHVCKEHDVSIKFHFDERLKTYVIDSIADKENWWYAAIYDGSFSPEEPVHRMDTHPFKDRMRIEVYQVSGERIEEIHAAFAAEAKRLESNEGKVIVSEVTIRTPNLNLKFTDVEVKAHGIRSDMFKPGVITGADIMLTLAEEGRLSLEAIWLDKVGRALVQGYFFTRFDQEKAEGRAGFTYSLGEKRRYLHKRRPGGFGNNHFHMTSDIRVILSPECIRWRWTDLSRRRRPGARRPSRGE